MRGFRDELQFDVIWGLHQIRIVKIVKNCSYQFLTIHKLEMVICF